MIYNQEKRYFSHDLDSIIKNIFGYSIPLNNIHNLILGIPKNIFDKKYNQYGYLDSAKYIVLGKIWRIHYIQYYNEPMIFPKKIKLCHKNIFLNIKIHHWIM